MDVAYVPVYFCGYNFRFSKIGLIQLAWECTEGDSFNIMDYQTVPIVTQVLSSNFFTAVIYGLQTNQSSIQFGCFHQLLVQGH
jgi:hypothetical protein